MDFGYTFAGFVVGIIVGMTGVGGGSLMTPLLVLMFGIHPATAVGTDLLYAAITKAGGTITHSLKGTVDWKVTGRLASGSIPAAATTLYLVSQFAPGGIGGASGTISFALGIALVLTALALIFRRNLQDFAQRHATLSERQTAVLTVITGAILGVLVSISSVGAGALGVTALILLYPRMSTIRIVGSDIAHAVPLTAVAGMGHWMLGSVDWSLLLALLLGSLPGITLGSHLSVKVPDRVLRPLLATLLVVIGGKLIAH
ncbi:MAG TPA: sulfite exporter TauE/SafE family protein [Rhodocyclaceae bacterium]|nr:sulfite exporter TauE/SafE family protein [Rhodocyclaceae bacterium]HMZ83794.1 sulfite exporter TauE/SafE family protein [Rhodocyclaceae bacterium]HNA04205.1 sulfite exporter TauE/SafE family protein [Rhodocyclaceae bacterium]HNB78821.1 sulfite exporter TauE/SafE family protein [Rhodocyclaceae bacterium]HNC61759.1 sulfite exporter TauE/SafE family protein [Rhodocyclaceae bacterium]